MRRSTSTTWSQSLSRKASSLARVSGSVGSTSLDQRATSTWMTIGAHSSSLPASASVSSSRDLVNRPSSWLRKARRTLASTTAREDRSATALLPQPRDGIGSASQRARHFGDGHAARLRRGFDPGVPHLQGAAQVVPAEVAHDRHPLAEKLPRLPQLSLRDETQHTSIVDLVLDRDVRPLTERRGHERSCHGTDRIRLPVSYTHLTLPTIYSV